MQQNCQKISRVFEKALMLLCSTYFDSLCIIHIRVLLRRVYNTSVQYMYLCGGGGVLPAFYVEIDLFLRRGVNISVHVSCSLLQNVTLRLVLTTQVVVW